MILSHQHKRIKRLYIYVFSNLTRISYNHSFLFYIFIEDGAHIQLVYNKSEVGRCLFYN